MLQESFSSVPPILHQPVYDESMREVGKVDRVWTDLTHRTCVQCILHDEDTALRMWEGKTSRLTIGRIDQDGKFRGVSVDVASVTISIVTCRW